MAAACPEQCCWAFQCLARSLLLLLISKEYLTPGSSENLTINGLLIPRRWFIVVRQRCVLTSRFFLWRRKACTISYDSQPSYLLMDDFQVLHLMVTTLNVFQDCGNAMDFICGGYTPNYRCWTLGSIGPLKDLLGMPMRTWWSPILMVRRWSGSRMSLSGYGQIGRRFHNQQLWTAGILWFVKYVASNWWLYISQKV